VAVVLYRALPQHYQQRQICYRLVVMLFIVCCLQIGAGILKQVAEAYRKLRGTLR
jgi:ABC-type long-subunit fatty acid transport system fused permease/ATPase subunit